MNKIFRILTITLICFLVGTSVYGQGSIPSNQVHVVQINGVVNPAMEAFIRDSIKQAERTGAQAILFEIDTYGGYVQSADDISKAIMATPLKTIAFVTRNAQSAGVLLTISCDQIAMAPGSSIGAASTIPETPKNMSFWIGRLTSVAQSQGRPEQIVAAMADKDIEIPGVIEKDKILTLDSKQALELKLSDLTARNLGEVLEGFGLESRSIYTVERDLRFRFLSIITDPVVSTILLTVAIVATITEFFMPGFGIAGTFGLISFVLYFGASLMAGAAGWTTILLFVAGVVLLLIEAAAPGFGVPGIGGILCILASVIFAAPDFSTGIYMLGVSLTASIVILAVILRFLPKRKFLSRIILEHSEKKELGYVGVNNFEKYIGAEGIALTPLRPSGTIIINDQKLDAVTEGGFIPKDSKIKVVQVEAMRIVVRALEQQQ